MLGFILLLCASGARANSYFGLPTVFLDSALVIGQLSGRVEKFLGIPYAQPPTGHLRFKLPQPMPAYNGTFTALTYGPACPQQNLEPIIPKGLAPEIAAFIRAVYTGASPGDEDCLSVNVIKPALSSPASGLPVIVWIYGGGFENGGSQLFDGGLIVERSIELGEPLIYISMNYRVSAFGFLAGQEVKDAGVGNLGLQDQREALRWIQKYIGAFGGDPSKVTIWGESAGAISVSLHLLTNGGDPEGLFRAAFMQSGSPIPVGDITLGQPYYDQLVMLTGCSGSPNTLECLREVPYPRLKEAVDASPGITSYQSLRLAWLPRADGVFLTDTPQNLIERGEVATVPMISGDCDDEGTIFALSSTNVTSESDFDEYIRTVIIPNISDTDLSTLLSLYTDNVTEGSPFDTGFLNAITPEYKRVAALLGDMTFQAPRRSFLKNRVGKQPIWGFISKRFKYLPTVGAAHATDILNDYGVGEMTDHLIRFTTTLNPNGDSDSNSNTGRRNWWGIDWPEYTDPNYEILQFNDGFEPQSVSRDNFREQEIEFLTELSGKYPI